MDQLALTLSSSHPDPKVLRTLVFVRRLALLLVALVAACIFLAWLSPAFARVMPASWNLMKVDTSLCILLCCLALQLCQSRRYRNADRLRQLVVGVTAAIVLLYSPSFNTSVVETWASTP